MKEIYLTQGKIALIDDEWFEEFIKYKWQAHYDPVTQAYYAVRRESVFLGHKSIQMSRVVIGAPENTFVDHIDHNTLNNQAENLRLATVAQNQYNRKPNRNNPTGYKGVKPHGRGYMARIRVNGVELYLGTWDTPQQAAAIYDKAAKEYFGDYAYLNFPESQL